MAGRILNATGTVTAITYPGAGGRPEVTVHLNIKGRLVELVFQSRRNLFGVDIGQSLRITGAVVTRQGSPCIYNPTYTIVKGHDE